MKVERIAVVGNRYDTLLGFRGELIRDLVAAGHQVYAFCMNYTPASKARVRALGAKPVSYGMGEHTINPWHELKTFWQLYRLFRHYRITLTFCYFNKPVIYGTLAARLAGVPRRVAKIEGLGRVFSETSIRNRLLRFILIRLYRLSLRYAEVLFVLNSDDRFDLVERFGVRPGRTEQLHGIGVCLEQYPYTGQPTDKVRFIFMGRLLYEKGIRYYLQAADTLSAQYPEAEFWVLGEPDNKHPRAVSRKELDDYVARGVIRYPGLVDNVVPYLAQSSVFVLPSFYREGVPRSTQEALAMGLAVISSDMPGCRETVQHGHNGYLIPAHDQAALIHAMERLIQSPERAVAMGRKGRKLAEAQFNVRHINQRILTVLKL